MGPTYFIMEKNYKPLLTEADEKLIEKLQLDTDPTSRLGSKYYPLRRKQIIDTYAGAFQEGTDFQDRLKYQTQMMDALQLLRQEYEADVNHAIELHLATINCWVPWKRTQVA